MTDGGAAQGGARDSALDGLDTLDQVLGAHADASIGLNTGDGVTVQILRTDGDTDNQLGEGGTVGADGRSQGSDLVVDVTTGGPETEQQGSLLLNGGLNSLNGSVGGATLNHSVQTGAGEAGSANQVLSVLELGNEVGLVAGATILIGRAIVETLVGGLSRGNGQSQSENLLHLHDESENIMNV